MMKFKWEAVRKEKDSLVIQLTFENPLYVSKDFNVISL
jgi:hypothetical protein